MDRIDNKILQSYLYFKIASKLKIFNKASIIFFCSIIIVIFYLIFHYIAGIGREENFFDQLFQKYYTHIFNVFNYKIPRNDVNTLAYWYIVATIIFFFLFLCILPGRVKRGWKILVKLSQYFERKEGKKLLRNAKEKLTNKKTIKIAYITTAIVFCIGECWVILMSDNNWNYLFIVILFSITIFLNTILVGSELHLAYSTFYIVKNKFPNLPTKLYDDEINYCFNELSNFIFITTLQWSIAMITIAPLFFLSGTAGILMFTFLGMIGSIFLFSSSWHLHKLMLTKKLSIKNMISIKLNELFEKQLKFANEEDKRKFDLLKDNYAVAESIKTWPFYSTISGVLQFLTPILPLIIDRIF